MRQAVSRYSAILQRQQGSRQVAKASPHHVETRSQGKEESSKASSQSRREQSFGAMLFAAGHSIHGQRRTSSVSYAVDVRLLEFGELG